ncbi:extensin family protein [Rhizobium sp. BK251]|uniref:extensin-like domain-containing protein n=1 Tax=Rhizobium sp. BK251 TaxID=2512125 RepID=UPI001045FC41|nr:extensin family protein [Rhizobium sp. BK251]TCL74711.1 hypothetical protein EV286_102272 [Rhizobium sp. BK251]
MRKLWATGITITCTLILLGATLPQRGPLPSEKPPEKQTAVPSPDAVPVPTQAPQSSPVEAPLPAEKPKTEERGVYGPVAPPGALPPSPSTPEEPKSLAEQHLTIEPESDAEHAACLKDLQAMGTTFREIKRIDDGNGCGIDKPIAVSEVLPGIKLLPEGQMRCEAALSLAHWLRESVIPAASVALKDKGDIVAVNQASSYICRLRNGAEAGKISEHARGNAIDIASFTLKKGKQVAVEPRREDSTLTGAFQRAVSASACLYFTTVLDPESDAAHENHFHLDVIDRKGGYRYCH